MRNDPHHIWIHGAREHNLKNLDVAIPKFKLVVITGLSGSGKSSLAYDTLYAEGQRRFLETLSTYARQFIRQMERPDVERITGIQPAIALEQKKARVHPRSTVGTLTEVYDFFRLLYARLGTPYCPNCEIPVRPQTIDQIVQTIYKQFSTSQTLAITAPIVRGRKGLYRREIQQALKLGYTWARIDGEWYRLEDAPPLDRNRHHTIDIVLDRLTPKPENADRIRQAVEQALNMADGFVRIIEWKGEASTLLSRAHRCPTCDFTFPDIEPWFFSFSSPKGACMVCQGVGLVDTKTLKRWRKDIPVWENLPPVRQWALWSEWYDEDELPSLTERSHPCPACEGTRLRPEVRYIRIQGMDITRVHAMEIHDALQFIRRCSFDKPQEPIAMPIRHEIERRLSFLSDVGVGYLQLDRMLHTLSTGEIQRVRLAAQLGSRLRGVLYVLDEPTVGLHPRDTERLIQILYRLRDMGNSIVVVEHDETTIRSADHIIDLGPGAGEHGGSIIVSGTVEDVIEHPRSLTGAYLSGRRTVFKREPLPLEDCDWLTVRGARKHNLKNLTFRIPLRRLTVVTGVSGSGKSTLVFEVLYEALQTLLNGKSLESFPWCDTVEGWESIHQVYHIDQSPIGKTPRSCPATYIGIFTHIRELMAAQETARIWGYTATHFSFNRIEGQCRDCKGMGYRRVKMHFLPDAFVVCESCQGRRYHRDILKVKWRNRSIADILDLTVDEALDLFHFHRKIAPKLEILHDLSLGYLRLGQPSHTLSGGESQRIKLARELTYRRGRHHLYLLDEPTTGLHAEDVNHLLNVLDRLIRQGHTVIVIEHHPDVMINADFILDLGPEGGRAGGEIVAQGTPQAIVSAPLSRTGQYLASRLGLTPVHSDFSSA